MVYGVSEEKHISGKVCSTTLFYPEAADAIYFNGLNWPLDPSSKGYHYVLMVICMLTVYTSCVPLKAKAAREVVKAYIDEVYAKFGESMKILSDNGTEFQLFTDVAT